MTSPPTICVACKDENSTEQQNIWIKNPNRRYNFIEYQLKVDGTIMIEIKILKLRGYLSGFVEF